jgi:small GTP-binding protein
MADAAQPDRSRVRLGMFGGGGVGKTALILRFLKNQFVEEYIPTLADDFRHDLNVDGRTIHLELIDTAGQDDFSEMRSHFYQSVQGFMLVYSVTDRQSLAEVEEIYGDICRGVSKPSVPAVLLGNKADLRNGESLTQQNGQDLAKKLGGLKIFETSARTGQNVELAFKEGVRVVHHMLFPKEGCCDVM